MVGGGDSGDVGLASDLLSDSHKVEIQNPRHNTRHWLGIYVCFMCIVSCLSIDAKADLFNASLNGRFGEQMRWQFAVEELQFDTAGGCYCQ